MNFLEAIKCLQEGKKVRKTYWTSNSYIYMDDEGDICDDLGCPYPLKRITDDSWEIYEKKSNEQDEYMVSDGLGGFIYAEPDEDDDDFIVLRMEVETDYGGDLYDDEYDKLLVSLHKDNIKELINILVNLL